MKKYLIIFLLLISCTSNQTDNNNSLDLKFSDDISFEEFKNMIEIYANNSPYPNIDN